MGRFGRIDTLVNNAGIFIAKPFTEYTEEDYDAVTGVNLARILPCHAARDRRRCSAEQGGGHVVKITTSLVDQPNASVPSVLASLTKGGLNAATKALAIEYAGRGIRVQRGRTGRHPDAHAPPETHEALAALHPVGRMGEIEDIVDAVVYLENAPFVTGEILHVDGGQSAGH